MKGKGYLGLCSSSFPFLSFLSLHLNLHLHLHHLSESYSDREILYFKHSL